MFHTLRGTNQAIHEINNCNKKIYNLPTHYCQSRLGQILSLRREGSLAQAKGSRLGEFSSSGHFELSLRLAHLAQARGLRSSDQLETEKGRATINLA